MRISGWFLLIVLLVGGIAGCSGGGGGGPLATSAQALGYAYKGAITNATVTLYALRSTGVRGEMIGDGQIDNQGFFDIAVANYTGWALAVLTGGLATDFLGNSSPIDPAFPLMGLVRLQAGVATLYSITILSTLVVYAMQAEMLRGGVRLRQAILNAEQRIGLMFGISLGLLTLIPFDLTSGPIAASPQVNYGAVTHGFCELAINLGISEVVLMHMLGRDILDGQLDGKYFNRDILSPTSILLPVNVWTVLWPLAITNFMLSPFNLSGLLAADIAAVATLSALTVLMLQAPLILSLYPRYLDVTRDMVYEARGPDMPTAANAKVTVGGQVIDALNVLDLAGGGLRVSVLTAVAALIDWGTKGKAHFEIEDTTSGLIATSRLKRIDSSLAPTITRLSPTVAAAGGGTLIEVEGENISDATTVRLGNVPAKVVAAGTNRLTYFSPRLSAGIYDFELTNPGGSATAPSAVTVKDKDLSAGVTETEARDQYSFAFQAGYDTDKFARFLFFDTEWNDNTVGSTTVNRTTVRENDTTARTDTINASSFYAQIGDEERQLHDTAGFNFFMLSARNQNVRAGNGPDAIVTGWETPTAVTPEILAGRHKVIVQQWNFEERWRRYMSGFAELGKDGVASIMLWCWETDLDTAITTIDLLWSAFNWTVGPDGHVTWSPLDGSTGFPNVGVWFDGNGRVGVGGGIDGNSVIYANSIRLSSGSGPYTSLGAFVGNHHRDETTVNGSTRQRTDIGFKRSIVGCDGAWSTPIDVVEQNTRFSDDSEIKFDWKIGAKLSLTASLGGQFDDQFGELGAVYRDDDFGAKLTGSVSGDGFDFGTQVFVPSFQSKESLFGTYFDVTLTNSSAGDGSSVESSDGRIALHNYDPDTAPQIDGRDFKLGGVRLTGVKAGQDIDRDDSRVVTVIPFTKTDPSPTNYAFAGRTVIYFLGDAADNLSVRRVGYLDPNSSALLLSNNGAGNRIATEIAFKAGTTPFSFDGRSYNVSRIERGYNLSNGDLGIAAETFSMDFSTGSVSGSGGRTEFFENNTTNTTSITVGGTYTGRMDGLTDFSSSGGRTWVLAPFIDGSSFVGVGVDTSGFQTLVYGTEVGTGVPATGNFASLRLAYSFDDFSPFPPKWSAVSGTFTDGFSGPSQITQTGSLGIRSNTSMEPTLFQMFQTSSIMFDVDRNVTYTEGTSTTRTGTASECQNVVTEADVPNRTVLLGLRLAW